MTTDRIKMVIKFRSQAQAIQDTCRGQNNSWQGMARVRLRQTSATAQIAKKPWASKSNPLEFGQCAAGTLGHHGHQNTPALSRSRYFPLFYVATMEKCSLPSMVNKHAPLRTIRVRKRSSLWFTFELKKRMHDRDILNINN